MALLDTEWNEWYPKLLFIAQLTSANIGKLALSINVLKHVSWN